MSAPLRHERRTSVAEHASYARLTGIRDQGLPDVSWGGLAERFKARVLKTRVGFHPTVSSNLTPSASHRQRATRWRQHSPSRSIRPGHQDSQSQAVAASPLARFEI